MGLKGKGGEERETKRKCEKILKSLRFHAFLVIIHSLSFFLSFFLSFSLYITCSSFTPQILLALDSVLKSAYKGAESQLQLLQRQMNDSSEFQQRSKGEKAIQALFILLHTHARLAQMVQGTVRDCVVEVKRIYSGVHRDTMTFKYV